MGGGAPCLRILDINSQELYPHLLKINIPAEPHRLSQLRELQISPANDVVKLVEALSSASLLLLETLTVKFFLPRAHDIGNDMHAVTFPPISPTKIPRSYLPSLRNLTVYTVSDLRSAIYFLNGIDMTVGNFNLKLEAFSKELSRKDTEDLAGLLSAYFHHFKGRPLSVQTEPLKIKYETTEELELPHSNDVPVLRILLASLTSVKRIFTSEGDFGATHSLGRLGDCGELLPALEEVQVAGIRGRAGADEFRVTVQKFASHRTARRGKPIKLIYSTWDGSGRRVDYCASFAD
ncbi:hypothetical protein CPC08DRAFT_725711 [Agrocybe pediades]|nr:hypothetical protein CPC08DRAFT_725711 [Agrocybe pediades]